MALSGIFAFLNLNNIKFTILPPDDIFALKPAAFKIKAKNRYFFWTFILRVKILDSEIVIPYLKEKETFIINLTFPHRGRYILKEVIISSYFPFYFFRRTKRIPINLEITIFPYPLKCDLSHFLSEGKTKIDSNISRGKSYEGELVGVRGYTYGDPLKYIHWKATAKTSLIKVKEFSPPVGTPIVLNLNDFSGNIEEKLSKTTYALIELIKRGNPVGLNLDKEFYPPETGQAHLRRMLYALAFYKSE